MGTLLFREDADVVRARLTAWWRGEDIGRPVLWITAPREKPLLDLPYREAPENWVTDYAAREIEYRVYRALQIFNGTEYFGEALPKVAADLGPGCLAAYLGCAIEEQKDTAWFQPCMPERVSDVFQWQEDNVYWQFTLELIAALRRAGEGKFLLEFPDILGGLDTLSAMRGPQTFLMDIIEDPEWVRDSLTQISDLYLQCYDRLYDLTRDETGGSHWWIWAPGKMGKFQCDFAAMIGPDHFREFALPALRAACQHTDFNMFHWDGPGALPHLDALLEVDELNMIQWVSGAGQLPPSDPKWWPLYHRMLEAKKKVFIHHCPTLDDLLALKREFGAGLKDFYIELQAHTHIEAEKLIQAAS